MKYFKRLTAIMLSAIMLIPPHTVMAEYRNGISITAKGNDTVYISENADNGSVLEITSDEQSIERDYAQCIKMIVRNISANPVKYYLSCVNTYDDIYINFVNNASEDIPLVILSGEEQEIELTVFAQNAMYGDYTIPVTAMTDDGKIASQHSLNFSCEGMRGSVEITADSDYLYTVKNVGENKIADLSLVLGGEAADYACIESPVTNYTLEAGESLNVKIVPDLLKMSSDGINSISGEICAKGGVNDTSKQIKLAPDTSSVEMIAIDRLSLYQSGNPYMMHR